jgi:hypothetical protein
VVPAHVRQPPAQAVAQQTPLAQNPLAQSSACAHMAPSPWSSLHSPAAVQVAPGLQSSVS